MPVTALSQCRGIGWVGGDGTARGEADGFEDDAGQLSSVLVDECRRGGGVVPGQHECAVSGPWREARRVEHRLRSLT